MPDSKTRIVISGMGAYSPYGKGVDLLWDGIVQGKSGISTLTLFDVSGCHSQIAGQAPIEADELQSRPTALALPALREALGQAGLLSANGQCSMPHAPLSISTTGGAMGYGEAFLRRVLEKHPEKSLHLISSYHPQRQVQDIIAHFGMQGTTATFANACASGANAIGHGADLIRSGQAECVITGGFEALTELIYVGFSSLQSMSEKACCPFAIDRDGLLLGEGAGFIILESETHAKQRGAQILGEFVGYGHSTDLHHITQPHPDGIALSKAMQGAVAQAQQSGRDPQEIGYVNAHGTATPMNDGAEAKSLVAFLRKHQAMAKISSTKAAIGHTLGAAGSIEAIITMKALQERMIPPQLNSTQFETVIQNDIAKAQAEPFTQALAMSVNLGFGGSNAALIFAQYEN